MRFVHLPKLDKSSHEKNGINGAQLKIFAMVCMLLDHIGVVLVIPLTLISRLSATDVFFTASQWETVYYVLRCVGRIAFPIFAFLIVEGFTHTRSRLKYLCNLGVFALLSEVPFDLALFGNAFTVYSQNVFFTLAFGLIALMLMEYISKQSRLKAYPQVAEHILTIVAVVLIALFSEWFRTDYGGIGVITICILYQCRQTKVTGAFISWIVLSLYNWLEICSLPFVLLVKHYNGQRGRQNKILFYAFYPLHLLILYGISKWIYL